MNITNELEVTVKITKRELDGNEFYRAVFQSEGEITALESRHFDQPSPEHIERDYFFSLVGTLIRRKYQEKFELGETETDKAWKAHPELIV